MVLSFNINDSSFCFINCHLAAGQKETGHRNSDIAAILESVVFDRSEETTIRPERYTGGGDGSMIMDHEICILNGDLNYRIDGIPRDKVISDIKNNRLANLLERDQLLLTRKRNPGFRLRAFTEHPITFAPTYKYDVHSDNYDSSEKRRSPAWCDRLLYRGLGRIEQLDYQRHELWVSDHRPVSGLFKIRVKTIQAEKRAAVRRQSEMRFVVERDRIQKETK